ncbi:hypothetical protein BDV93DRAFT_527019 [Ceratobasidium sp. AG-I]|nr:hypothetical protein BDV93DRAFT_527019 [Ceratobasidium sp. AG-I]
MDNQSIPDEILLHIIRYLGARYTHNLRDSTLVSRRWHLIAASIPLSTIAVSSLGDLSRLCGSHSFRLRSLRVSPWLTSWH